MKLAIIAIVVLLAFSVESANHKKHKAMKSSEASNWPQPEVIRNFEVPPEFTAPPTSIDGNDQESTTPSGRHHGKPQRSRTD